MIQVYIGTNKQDAITKIKSIHNTLDFVYLDCEAIDEVGVQSSISGQSLFVGRRLVIVNGVYSIYGNDTYELSIHLAHNSQDEFLFLEDKLLKKQKDLLDSLNISYFEDTKEITPKDNRIYTAIQSRDKKLAWIALSYLYTIDTAEYAHGAIYTAYKSLLEASIASQQKLGRQETSFTSDWVFQKSVQAAKLYTQEELRDNLLLLARMLQQGHGDEGKKLDSLLEQFVLERI